MGPVAKRLIEYAEVTAIAILLAFFLRTFVVQAFKIPTGSMEDTLLRGDHILVNKMIYHHDGLGPFRHLLPVRKPKRYDVLVFKYPKKLKLDYIKRMVGLPGDSIVVRRKELYVNGKRARSDFVKHASPWILPRIRGCRDYFGPLKVPPHSYFMMGDNRDNSLDSRYWGCLPEGLIKGKAFIIYWSWTPLKSCFAGEEERIKMPRTLPELIWFNITHFGQRLRWRRFLNIIR